MSEIIIYNYKISNLWLLFMAFQIEVREVQLIILTKLVNVESRLLKASSPTKPVDKSKLSLLLKAVMEKYYHHRALTVSWGRQGKIDI